MPVRSTTSSRWASSASAAAGWSRSSMAAANSDANIAESRLRRPDLCSAFSSAGEDQVGLASDFLACGRVIGDFLGDPLRLQRPVTYRHDPTGGQPQTDIFRNRFPGKTIEPFARLAKLPLGDEK